jgi:hypothetical protein
MRLPPAAGDAGDAGHAGASGETAGVAIAFDPADPVARSAPVAWAVEELRGVLARRGLPARVSPPDGPPPAAFHLRLTALDGPSDRPAGPEQLSIQGEGPQGGRRLRLAGSDPRGLVYALLEVSERVAGAPDPPAVLDVLRALRDGPPLEGRPANRVRGVLRTFSSDVEDLPLFYDREAWRGFLTMLAAQRFNRFHLALGIGYDFARGMRDSYFYFPYPFLLHVPGYDVRAGGVTDQERERNLAALRFVAAETRRRGLHFQLGLWASVYEFQESPAVNHPISGLTPETHAPYCRDALRTLLQAIPEIDGVTLRVHGESGIPEGSYDFWETVLAGVAGCGRRVQLDLHSKGIDGRMIDLALATGQPVEVSPKFWAEHLGLPYHQAEIRALEQPGPPSETPSGAHSPPPLDPAHGKLMALSTGSRRFTRYGYADLLREDRRYGVLYRVWPGTHRLLLWGDPVTGRGYAHAFAFGGARGVELFEPLAFSGRRGSGRPGGRNPYADADLRPLAGDWVKYAHTYRLWGRLLYDPGAGPEQWRPALEAELGGAGAAPAEAALANASRILPLVTTAHHPSAANNSYWPELYTDIPIVEGSHPHPYRDTPSPRRCGTVSPLDPALFCGVEEFVAERLAGTSSGRYGPPEVARWLEQLAGAALRYLAAASEQAPDWAAPPFRRWAIDVRIEAGLGRFFAGKLRAATGYALYQRTGDVASLRAAHAHYRAARAAWAETAGAARGVYQSDLAFGPEPHLRGHWADRLAAIDADLAAMTAELAQARLAQTRQRRPGPAPDPPRPGATPAPSPQVALDSLLAERPPELALAHDPPGSFTPGAPLPLEAQLLGPVATARLHYRHVNQAERFSTLDLSLSPEGVESATMRGRGVIPGAYTASPYALQYYFVLGDGAGQARLWPGLDAAGPEPRLANQPYYVVRPSPSASGGK